VGRLFGGRSRVQINADSFLDTFSESPFPKGCYRFVTVAVDARSEVAEHSVSLHQRPIGQ